MKDFDNYIVYDKHVAFWGSELSNFHPCSFVYKDYTWKSSEQAYMAEKAIFFRDYAILDEILAAKTPKEAKKLGRQVKNFNADEWGKVSFYIMYNIVYQKFSQNDYLKELITNPEWDGKHFVEGSPVDGIWGVKVSWDDPRIDDELNWDGKNWMGRVLDKVRMDLITEKIASNI